MHSRFPLLLLILVAFALRIYALDAKGLAYDEAATALMAQATPQAIMAFHWQAAFEHPPLWQLLMYGWSQLVGQSEFALRFLPMLAGVIQVPLLCWLMRQVVLGNWRSPQSPISSLQSPPSLVILACLLLTLSPVLILYSQEARMYTLVGALGLASLGLTVRIMDWPKRTVRTAFVLVNWAMTLLHYYSLLLIAVEALIWGIWVLRERALRWRWRDYLGTLALALLPIGAWLALAPGFHDTLAVVLDHAQQNPQPGLGRFLSNLWLDLTFGAIRWTPPQAWLGYLLLPLCLLGILTWAVPGEALVGVSRERQDWWRRWLLVLLLIIPVVLSALLFPTLATRYLLFIVPALYGLSAVGVVALARWWHPLGWSGLALTLAVAGAGLMHYFTAYQKSDYREMARFLTARLAPGDGVLLEAPRQHLLAKYYLPADQTYYSAPAITLPDFWPVNAPPVVPEEMDDVIQTILGRHERLWLILTAETEVDRGEFVPKYLTAVSFRADCQEWVDVRLCLYLSPHFAQPTRTQPYQVRFGGELLLRGASFSLTNSADDARFLLITLHWLAQAKPTLDYRVTLRLLDGNGVTLQQHDGLPIGPLLPPSTWHAGDEKPGYLVLSLPAELPHGLYQTVVGVYDPATLTPLSAMGADGAGRGEFLPLTQVTIGEQILIR
jgi:hypothetical protein